MASWIHIPRSKTPPKQPKNARQVPKELLLLLLCTTVPLAESERAGKKFKSRSQNQKSFQLLSKAPVVEDAFDSFRRVLRLMRTGELDFKTIKSCFALKFAVGQLLDFMGSGSLSSSQFCEYFQGEPEIIGAVIGETYKQDRLLISRLINEVVKLDVSDEVIFAIGRASTALASQWNDHDVSDTLDPKFFIGALLNRHGPEQQKVSQFLLGVLRGLVETMEPGTAIGEEINTGQNFNALLELVNMLKTQF